MTGWNDHSLELANKIDEQLITTIDEQVGREQLNSTDIY